MAAIELITKEDLKEFKNELISELKSLIQPGQPQAKQWMKSSDVRKMLNISPGTLQNLRINGTLKFTKVGGIMYYKSVEIYEMFNQGKDSK